MNEDENRGREAEVGIQFDLTVMTPEQRQKLFEVERLLGELGVAFDRGSDGRQRDWEWDWSLRGPVRVVFQRFTDENPENRHTRADEAMPEDLARIERELVGKLADAKARWPEPEPEKPN